MCVGDGHLPRQGRPLTSGDPLTRLEDAPCGLLQTALDGRILHANRTFCTWVGRAAADLVSKKRLQDLLTVGGRIFHQTHWAPLLQMQGSLSEVKLEVLHADGTAIPMVFNAIRRENADGPVNDVAVFVARDRDKYEQELVRSRQRLERLEADARDRALLAEQMIGIVSHDLRNPMSTIHMGTALLERSDLTPNQLATLARITRATSRANRLIADLLDFTGARLGRGLGITVDAIDLHRSVGEVVDELAFAHSGRTLEHEREGDGGCSADANRLMQVVGNLVANAFAYGDAASPVTVRTKSDDGSCAIEVHNAGVPIPAEAQARIFEPMTRGEEARGAGRSVGLGLFIVSEIAKAHGGSASVTSTAESGTTFRITFPRTR